MARSLRRLAQNINSGVYRGCNLAGLEYGTPVQLSNDYYAYLARKGFNLVRLPFDWENLQPEVLGEFDATFKGYIDDNITWANNNGIKIILDCHNYGRRDIGATEQIIGDGVLTYAHFNDLWTRISTLYKNEAGVLAYDLMNEPHDMPIPSDQTTYKTTATWTVAAQGCLNAIRANGDNKLIFITCDWWGSVQNFLKSYSYGSNPDMFITDSVNNVGLTFHCYFDSNQNGAYTGANAFFSGSGKNVQWVGDAAEAVCQWAKVRNIPLFFGEYAVPEYDNAYLTSLEDFMKIMNKYGVMGCWFAMGLGITHKISLDPRLSYAEDKKQMQILTKYL